MCAFPPLPVYCSVQACFKTAAVGPKKKKKEWCVGGNNRFSYAKLTNAGERRLKQTSWTVAAERERLGLPNDSLQVVTE